MRFLKIGDWSAVPMLRNQVWEQNSPLLWAMEDHWPPKWGSWGGCHQARSQKPGCSEGDEWAEAVHSDNILKKVFLWKRRYRDREVAEKGGGQVWILFLSGKDLLVSKSLRKEPGWEKKETVYVVEGKFPREEGRDPHHRTGISEEEQPLLQHQTEDKQRWPENKTQKTHMTYPPAPTRTRTSWHPVQCSSSHIVFSPLAQIRMFKGQWGN